MKAKSTTTAPAAGRMVRLRNSVILSGPPAKFIKFHEPVALADLPEKFHSLIIDESKSPEPSGPPDSRFFLNTPYHVRADDKLGARVEREAAQMAAQAEEDDYLQEQLNRPPPPEVAAAIKDAQEVYIADINRQLAEGKARAAKDDLEDSLVQAEAENRNGEGFEEGEVYNADARPPQRTVAEFFAARDAKSPESDAPYAPPQSQPGILDEAAPKKQMRVRYVCRNGTWLRTKRLKRFHVGEKVYIKDASGKFEVAGKVNKAGHLPAVYAEESK